MPFVQPHAPKIEAAGGIIRDGLLERWNFPEGSGNTTTGENGTIGTPNTGVINWTPGFSPVFDNANAVWFDAFPQWMTFGNTINPRVSISVVFWFRADRAAGEYGNTGPVGKWGTGGTQWAAYSQSLSHRFSIFNDVGQLAVPNFILADQLPHLFIMTYEAGTLNVFCDDEEKGPVSNGGGDIIAGTAPLFLGSYNGSDTCHGYYDDYRIYNRVLNATERAAIYAGNG